MRHLGSLLAALVITPIAWVLIAAGQPRTMQIFERWSTANTASTADLLAPLALVAGAGVLIGLIATLQWSPVGPLVAGLLLLGGYGIALIRPFLLLDALPVKLINGARVDLGAPLTNGTMAVLGSAMIMAALSPRRWRRRPASTSTTPPAKDDLWRASEAEAPAADAYRPQTPADAYRPPTGTGYPGTAEDLSPVSRYRPTGDQYVPPPRRASTADGDPTMDERTMDDISAGPDRPASVNETEQAPFSSPWTRPPRPPEG